MANKRINEFPLDTSIEDADLHVFGDPTTGALKKTPHTTLTSRAEILTNKSISGATNTITNIPAASLTGLVEIAATKAAVNVATHQRLVYVTADETNNGDTSLYLHTGSTLKFLQTVA